MPRTKIRFDNISQLNLWEGQICLEEVGEERAIDVPPEEELVVLAGRGSHRNPKKNIDPAATYLVRRVGPGVTKCKVGDWVLLGWQAVNEPSSPTFISTFAIKGGNFALCVEGSIAGAIKSLGAAN